MHYKIYESILAYHVTPPEKAENVGCKFNYWAFIVLKQYPSTEEKNCATVMLSCNLKGLEIK